MQWIMSAGGPLVCLEQTLENSWGGVDKLTVPCAGAATDYERACQPYRKKGYKYVNNIPVIGGGALLFGDTCLDTTVYKENSGNLLIVRVVFAEKSFDDLFEKMMMNLHSSVFDDVADVTEFEFMTSHISLFDSAEPGYAATKDKLLFETIPGRYRIVTAEYEPDSENSLIIHKLLPMLGV